MIEYNSGRSFDKKALVLPINKYETGQRMRMFEGEIAYHSPKRVGRWSDEQLMPMSQGHRWREVDYKSFHEGGVSMSAMARLEVEEFNQRMNWNA